VEIGEGHLVGICLDDSEDFNNYLLLGQGTLDPVMRDGTPHAECAAPSVLARDSGINGVYTFSITGFVTGSVNIALRLFVDDMSTPLPGPVTVPATFSPICFSL
jgi:hypothetical protein